MDNKEKLEEAKRLYETANADQKYVLESLFPELRESEDEKLVKNLISTLSNLYARNLIEKETKEKYTNLLKSLRPQNTWKPSDEQINALDFFIDCIVPDEFNYKKQTLKDLLEQLKKL